MSPMPIIQSLISRRIFCGAAGGSIAAAMALPSQAIAAGATGATGAAITPSGRGGINLSREEQLEFLIRFMASLEEEDCTWYYYGRLLAQVGDTTPKAFCGLVGAETYWAKKQADGSYVLSASTFSYPTELNSDEPLQRFKNPYTGEVNTPVPNLYRNDRATVMTLDGMVHGEGLAPDDYNMSISQIGDLMFAVSDIGQAFRPQPHRELSTKVINVKEYENPAVKNLSGISNDVFISRWPKWMNMGDRPGHILWQVGAKKVRSHSELPPRYYNRIMSEHPTHLSARPGTAGTTDIVY